MAGLKITIWNRRYIFICGWFPLSYMFVRNWFFFKQLFVGHKNCLVLSFRYDSVWLLFIGAPKQMTTILNLNVVPILSSMLSVDTTYLRIENCCHLILYLPRKFANTCKDYTAIIREGVLDKLRLFLFWQPLTHAVHKTLYLPWSGRPHYF